MTYSPSPPHSNLAPAFLPTSSLPSPPEYPAPSLPQSTRLSTIQGSQHMSPPAPTTPVAADQASLSPDRLSFPALPQDHYSQTPDFYDHSHDNGLSDWEVTEEFEVFLRGAQGSEPSDSRCAASGHLASKECVANELDHQDLSSTGESVDDLSDLCFQDLGDFNLSDLEISAAMIDYLLGWPLKPCEESGVFCIRL